MTRLLPPWKSHWKCFSDGSEKGLPGQMEWGAVFFFFFCKCVVFNCIYLIFGYTESSVLCAGFLRLQWMGATLGCNVQASHWAVLMDSTGCRHTGPSAPQRVGSSWIRN